jgi:hypothetical protein
MTHPGTIFQTQMCRIFQLERLQGSKATRLYRMEMENGKKHFIRNIVVLQTNLHWSVTSWALILPSSNGLKFEWTTLW